MSTNYRRAISSDCTRLKKYLDELVDIHDLQTIDGAPPPANEVISFDHKIQNEILKIQKAVDRIRDQNSQYNAYLQSLSGDERKQEDLLLEDYLDNKWNFHDLINDAEETITGYMTNRAELSDTLTVIRGGTVSLKQRDGTVRDQPQPTDATGSHSGGGSQGGAQTAPQIGPDGNGTGPINLSSVASALQGVANAKVKLPTISLMHFSGNPLTWPAFFENYSTAVHNQQIEVSAKWVYLTSCLEGEAKDLISGFAKTEANYTAAIDLLKATYGNDNIIINHLWDKLRSLKPLSSEVSNTAQIRKMLDEICATVRSLENMGQDIDNEKYLLKEITSKFNWIVLSGISLFDNSSDWSISSFLDLVRKFIDTQEKIKRHTFLKPLEMQSADESAGLEMNRQGTLDAFAATQNSGNSKGYQTKRFGGSHHDNGKGRDSFNRRGCFLCDGNHRFRYCTKYPKPYDKYKAAKQRNLCGKCLKPWSHGHSCGPYRVCDKCAQYGKFHNEYLCFTGEKSPGNNGKRPPDKTSTRGAEKDAEKDDESPRNTTVGAAANRESVKGLLMTANVKIKAPSRAGEAKLFFDTGCDSTFVSEEFTRKFKLKPSRKQMLSVQTFAADKPQQIQSGIFEFEIQLKNGEKMLIEAFSVPDIGVTIQRSSLSQEDMAAMSLNIKDMADDLPHSEESTRPDILIGNDYFLDFVMPSKFQLPSGLHLLDSKVGFLLGGKQKTVDAPVTRRQSYLISTKLRSEASVNDALTISQPNREMAINEDTFSSLELIGINESASSKDDETAAQIFSETIKREEDGRYEVSLLWNSLKCDLPTNKGIAFGRFRSLYDGKLKKNESLKIAIDEILQTQEKEKIIGECSGEDYGHFLPSFPVQNETGKVRVVLDGSTKASRRSLSLNDCLFRGSVILPQLVGIILRFRTFKHPILSDLKAAYHMLKLREEDQPFTKFFLGQGYKQTHQ